MNQVNQVHTTEHNLKLVKGHSIVGSKKKRLTDAPCSSDKDGQGFNVYKRPATYSDFVQELIVANKVTKTLNKILGLAPLMEKKLTAVKEWDTPSLAMETTPSVKMLLDPISIVKLDSSLLGKQIERLEFSSANPTNIVGIA